MDRPSLNTKGTIGRSSDAGSQASALRRRVARSLALIVIVVALAIVVGTGLIIFELRANALQAGEREVRHLAAMAAPEIDLSVQAIERVQKGLIDRVNRIEIKSAPDYETRLSGDDAHLMLKDVISGLPHIEVDHFCQREWKSLQYVQGMAERPDRYFRPRLFQNADRRSASRICVERSGTQSHHRYMVDVFGPQSVESEP